MRRYHPLNTDFIYYLNVDGELLDDLIFSTEELAEEFAKEQGYENYWILKWSVD